MRSAQRHAASMRHRERRTARFVSDGEQILVVESSRFRPSFFYLMPISLSPISIIILAILAILFAWQFIMWRKWRTIFRGESARSLAGVIETQVVKTKKIEGEIRRQLDEILKIQAEQLRAFQKMHMMRFNSIEETGANQSFALVALDGNNNGIILTSLYLGNTPRLFIKQVTRGASQQKLSPEEEQALHEALTQS